MAKKLPRTTKSDQLNPSPRAISDTKTPVKNKGGRMPKYTSPRALQQTVDVYFATTPRDNWTVSGLALHLGINPRTLLAYQGDGDDTEFGKLRGFSPIIKRAKAQIMVVYEEQGNQKGRAFDIFRLKAMGWKDGDREGTGINENVGVGINQLNMTEEERKMIRSLIGTRRKKARCSTNL